MEDNRIVKGKGGRPVGSKNAIPQPPPGWHIDIVEAGIQGVSIHQLRVRARLGISPKPVKYCGHDYYRDDGMAEHLAELKRRQEQAAEPPRRGRPRKVTSAGQRGSAPLAAE